MSYHLNYWLSILTFLGLIAGFIMLMIYGPQILGTILDAIFPTKEVKNTTGEVTSREEVEKLLANERFNAEREKSKGKDGENTYYQKYY